MENKIKRGEIYYANLDPINGHEQGGLRPVLVIQNDVGNKHSPTTIVAAITSATKPSLPTHIHIKQAKRLPMNSIVMCEQIRTLDKSRLSDRLMMLDDAIMREVNRAIQISLDIDLQPIYKTSKMEMCLCHRCSQQFYDSPAHYIERTDSSQTEKHNCDWCGVRTGFDYVISNKSKTDFSTKDRRAKP